ncbi:MAG: hypothetical protein SFY67_14645 [Candidatus Melainabacteria bacterium]|nr:hypothetical protein [Candidatus Melainabacteria bacterium]
MPRLLSIALCLLLITAFNASSVCAQYGQGFDSEELHAVALRAGDAMRAWHKQHGSFPNLDQDLDKALRFVCEKVNGAPVSSTTQVTYSGSVHSIDNIRMTVDRSITNAPIEEWKSRPPATWTAPANSTVILTDGKNQFLIWTSVISGTPMRDSNEKCKFVYGKLKPAVKEDEDSDTSED